MVESSAARFVRLEMEGLAELSRDLRRASASVDDMSRAHSAVADMVAQGARREVPVRTGRLKAAVHGIGKPSYALLVAGNAGVEYAGPIHFGWATRGIGRGKKSEELIGTLGSKSRSRRHGTAGVFTDKVLRKAARSQNRKSNAKKGRVRGGPIAPNPFLYRALDQRFDAVVAEYDKHIDGIARAVEAGTI